MPIFRIVYKQAAFPAVTISTLCVAIFGGNESIIGRFCHQELISAVAHRAHLPQRGRETEPKIPPQYLSAREFSLFTARDRIENAFRSRDYVGGVSGERLRRSKNDSIFARLDPQFTEDQAMQHSVAIKGAGVTLNSVRQMLKNWRKQGLIERLEDNRFRKL